MVSDSRDVSADGTIMAQGAVSLSTRARRVAGRKKGQIDMTHRRWIDQILAESQSQSVILPWARASARVAAGSARKIPQDVS